MQYSSLSAESKNAVVGREIFTSCNSIPSLPQSVFLAPSVSTTHLGNPTLEGITATAACLLSDGVFFLLSNLIPSVQLTGAVIISESIK